MAKPPIIATKKPLPFNELSPLEFERMCLWLVEREGYERPQHLGEAGNEQGRDIVAYKKKQKGEETWYFQCKRYNQINSKVLEREVDKYNLLATLTPEKRPKGIIFITSSTVSARIRDKVGSYCKKYGYEYDFWARTELDMRVKKHSDIVDEFFLALYSKNSDNNVITCSSAISRMIEDYTAVFGGRGKELTQINNFLISNEYSYVLLLAPTGRGKTAFLIQSIEKLKLNKEWTIVFHPISRRYQTATAEISLGALTNELTKFYGVKLEGYNNNPEQLQFLIADLLRREPLGGKKLLLVIDGLDEAVGWEVSRTLFPRQLPKNIKIIVSAREIALRSRQDWLEQIGWSSSQTLEIILQPLDRNGIADVLNQMGKSSFKFATNEKLLTEIQRICEGDPLTLRFLVESIRNGELAYTALTKSPPGLEAFIDYWMRELEPNLVANELVYNFLGILGAALAPLSNEDLESIAPEIFSRRYEIREVARRVERFIIGNGSIQNGYVLSHPRLREIFFERLSESERDFFKEYFVRYGVIWWNTRLKSPPQYIRLFWIKHLAEASNWDLIRRVVSDFEQTSEGFWQPWCNIRHNAEGSYRGYIDDLNILWTEAEKNNDFLLSIRCALIFATIRNISANFPPELIADLVKVGTTHGRWTATTALEYIKQIPDSHLQVDALTALADITPDFPIETGLDIIATIQNEGEQLRALNSIFSVTTPNVTPEQQHELLVIASGFKKPELGVSAFCKIASFLQSKQKKFALERALNTARKIEEQKSRISSLKKIALEYSKKYQIPILKEAFELALEIKEESERLQALALLEKHLPPELKSKARTEIKSLKGVKLRGRDLINSFYFLPQEFHDEIWKNGIEFVASPMSGDLLTRVAKSGISLSTRARKQLIPFARSIENPEGRARALAALAFTIKGNAQRKIWSEVIEAARAVKHTDMPSDTSMKAQTWLDVLPLMPPEICNDLWSEVIDSTTGPFSGHFWQYGDSFCDLTEILPNDLLPKALTIARKDSSNPAFSKRLVYLGRRFSGEEQKALLDEALKSAQRIDDDYSIAGFIGAIGPYLESSVALNFLNKAREIRQSTSQFMAIQGLAQSLPKEECLTTWQEAFNLIQKDNSSISDDWQWGLKISDAAPAIPPELIPRAINIVLTMNQPEAIARTLCEIVKRLSGDEALKIWHHVFKASHYSFSYLGIALSNLQKRIDPDKLLQVWENYLISFIKIEDKILRHWALEGIAPYLPPSLITIAIDATENITDRMEALDRVDILLKLIPNSPPELFPRLFKIARGGGEGHRAQLIGALAGRFFGDEKDLLLEETLSILESIDFGLDKLHGLKAVIPNITPRFMNQALKVALSISEHEYRAEALIAFGNKLPSTLLSEALYSARLISEDWRRVQVLRALSLLLATEAAKSESFAKLSLILWEQTLRVLSRYGRTDFLNALAALMPWLASITPSKDLEEVLNAIFETRKLNA